MNSGKVVETFPRPPYYYKEFSDDAQHLKPRLEDVDLQILRDELYGGLFSEKSLQFVKFDESNSVVTPLHLKTQLLEHLDMITLQCGNILNMKTVEGPHIIEMKSNLQAMLEEFHRLLSRCRHYESKVQLLDQLNQRNQKLQCLEEDMNT